MCNGTPGRRLILALVALLAAAAMAFVAYEAGNGPWIWLFLGALAVRRALPDLRAWRSQCTIPAAPQQPPQSTDPSRCR